MATNPAKSTGSRASDRELLIYIPSYRRAEHELVSHDLCLATRYAAQTHLVVNAGEEETAYRARYPKANILPVTLAEPCIGKVRNFILEHALTVGTEVALMMDDDLFFYHWQPRPWDPTCIDGVRLRDITPMLELLHAYGLMHAMVGTHKQDLPGKRNAIACGEDFFPFGKLFNMYALNVATFKRHNLRFWDHMAEDFEMQLRLTSMGYVTGRLNWYANETVAAAKQGATGCLAYRNPENQALSVMVLKERYPQSVRIRTFKTNGFVRKDAAISVKREYELWKSIGHPTSKGPNCRDAG